MATYNQLSTRETLVEGYTADTVRDISDQMSNFAIRVEGDNYEFHLNLVKTRLGKEVERKQIEMKQCDKSDFDNFSAPRPDQQAQI